MLDLFGEIRVRPGSFVPTTGEYQMIDVRGRAIGKPFLMFKGTRAAPTVDRGWGWVYVWPASGNAA